MEDEMVSRYSTVLNELRDASPATWSEVVTLCKAVPKTIDIDTFWKHGKDKPCWSNIRVDVGERIAEDLSHSADFECFRLIASDNWKIKMLKRGPNWRANTNFQVVGDAAQEYLACLDNGGLASYKWRLYAIRQYALSLGDENGVLPMVRSVIENPHFLHAEEIYKWSQRFAQRAGYGWGPTTVNHLLCDLGLSVKPDLHLRRSAVRMGLLNNVQSNLPVDEIDRNHAQLDRLVVPAVINLASKVTPTAAPGSRSAMREVDKVLMEWSRKDLLRAL